MHSSHKTSPEGCTRCGATETTRTRAEAECVKDAFIPWDEIKAEMSTDWSGYLQEFRAYVEARPEIASADRTPYEWALEFVFWLHPKGDRR